MRNSYFKSCVIALSLLSYSAKADNSGGFPIESLTKDIRISGFVDGSYVYNPESPSSGNNVGRIFDTDSNNFTFHAAEIAFQKVAVPDSPVGFRVDLYAGEDAKGIHAAGLGQPDDTFDIQQGYVEYSPADSWIFRAGKFVTLAGAELIEAKDNWNISRGYVFGFVAPYTHTGVRSTYTFSNSWDATLGLVNGWDNAEDNNDGKTVEAHFGFNNIEMPWESAMTIALQGYFGPETTDNESNIRSLVDAVVTYKTPWKPLTLMYNFDYATDENAAASGEDASWISHAAYARLQLADNWTFAARGEYVDDEDGVRIVPGVGTKYTTWTGTLEYRPAPGFITRVEARHDRADDAVYDADEGEKTDSQTTLAAQVIVFFG
jgi:hypothetical protein